MHRQSFNEWSGQVLAILQANGVPPSLERLWRNFHRQGYTPAQVFDVLREAHECCLAADQDD